MGTIGDAEKIAESELFVLRKGYPMGRLKYVSREELYERLY